MPGRFLIRLGCSAIAIEYQPLTSRERSPPMSTKLVPEILPVTLSQAAEYAAWFVNRLAHVRQSDNPGEKSGKHYYYKAVASKTAELIPLKFSTIQAHIAGWLTVGIYAIAPGTQTSRWVAIDADYNDALKDLEKLRDAFASDGLEALMEQSRRGAHLWLLFAEPVPAAMCRLYTLFRANQLKVPIKRRGDDDGIEVFPRQDSVTDDEFGNAIRAPLGIHRASMQRYWFDGAEPNLEDQFALLRKTKRVSKEELEHMTADMVMPTSVFEPAFIPQVHSSWESGVKVIHLGRMRRTNKNYKAQCPSCASMGGDKKRSHFSISVAEPTLYHCWNNCTSDMIKKALGVAANERISFAV
jgi:hypothetical protein